MAREHQFGTAGRFALRLVFACLIPVLAGGCADDPPDVAIDLGRTEAAEGDEWEVVVKLRSRPARAVVVDLVDPAGRFEVVGARAAFDPSRWQSEQRLQLRARFDADGESQASRLSVVANGRSAQQIELRQRDTWIRRPPTFDLPDDGMTVRARVQIGVDATDRNSFRVRAGRTEIAVDTEPPFVFDLDPAMLTPGRWRLTFVAEDRAGSVEVTRNIEVPPRPGEPAIRDLEFDFSKHERLAEGSDNWPVTWGVDGHMYTCWGDGGGFGGTNKQGRVSLGFGRIEGGPMAPRGHNVWGGFDSTSPAAFDGKCYGIVDLAGTLYAWSGPGSGTESYRETRIAISRDKGRTWSRASWWFTKSDRLIMPTILQFGPGYAGAVDDYVYVYFIRLQGDPKSLDVHRPGIIDLARVPRDSMLRRESYEFYSGRGPGGAPRWSADPERREPVVVQPHGVGWNCSVSYNPHLRRYFLWTEHSKSFQGNVSLLESMHPWGPWRTVREWSGWGAPAIEATSFFWNFANKWSSDDGRGFVLVFTGIRSNDSFNTVPGVFALQTADD